VAYPQAGVPRIIYSLKLWTRRQRSSCSGWLLQVKTIRIVPSECSKIKKNFRHLLEGSVWKDQRKFARENIYKEEFIFLSVQGSESSKYGFSSTLKRLRGLKFCLYRADCVQTKVSVVHNQKLQLES
jgi:hypothetical protein